MTERTVAFETRAAIEPQRDDRLAIGQRWRELGRRRPVDRDHLRSGRRRYVFLARITRFLQPLALRGGVLGGIARRLAPPLRAWTKARELRPAAPRSFRDVWRDGLGEGERR